MAPSAQDLYEACRSSVRGDNIANRVFHLHYQWSFLLLTYATAVATAHLWRDGYVSCTSSGADSPQREQVNSYAYYLSTFTTGQKDGLGPEDKIRNEQSYYRWVILLFTYHAIISRMTHFIWCKTGGSILIKLNDPKVRVEDDFIGLLKRNVENRIRYGLNKEWLFHLLSVEVMNILVCLHQWLTTDCLFKWKFSRLGLSLFTSFEYADLMFPISVKFLFWSYGPSGGLKVNDYLCVLGLNLMYKVMFIIYWYWLVLLTLASVLNLVYRLVQSRCYRHKWQSLLSCSGYRMSYKQKCWLRSLCYHDWLFLQYVQSNLSILQNQSLISCLSRGRINRISDDSFIESGEDIEVGIEQEEEEGDGSGYENARMEEARMFIHNPSFYECTEC